LQQKVYLSATDNNNAFMKILPGTHSNWHMTIQNNTCCYIVLVPSLAAVSRYFSGSKNIIDVILREWRFDLYDNTVPFNMSNICMRKTNKSIRKCSLLQEH